MKNAILLALVLVLSLTTMSLAAEYTWAQKVDMPTARWIHSASVVDGKIYVISGATSEPGMAGISAMEVYDPVMDEWTTEADIRTPRGAFSTSVVDGGIYAIGGGDLVSRFDPPAPLSAVEEYDTGFMPEEPITSIEALFWGALKATFR